MFSEKITFVFWHLSVIFYCLKYLITFFPV